MHDLHPATRTLATLVERVDDVELAKPTPCPEYTVGDLLDHIGRLAVAFVEAARKEDGTNVSPPARAHVPTSPTTGARGSRGTSPPWATRG